MSHKFESKDKEIGSAAVVESMENWPDDYAVRVYAGVLGKCIGVYLGRPIENWTYDRISQEFGDVDYYIHEKRNRQLVITDDDISGTFTFLRAIRDYGYSPHITPKQIGQTWLNYLIENTTILWWGGLGNSTEHTAYLRLREGIDPPESGSIRRNSKVVAEQIGAQIFIEGWGMIAPNDPELAAHLARRAACVSHDGEAIYAAQVIACMVSLAFSGEEVPKLLDGALEQIPSDCVIREMIDTIREWHAGESDWRLNREKLEKRYGYHRFQGNVHIVPNHGLIILSLLHGENDFHRSLSIVNTSGWDTDCNSGNVGCILGVRGGIDSIDDGPDWRGPVADRLLLPSADPGASISDAAREAMNIINAYRAMNGHAQISPKAGARFHFTFPGSVQGFQSDGASGGNCAQRVGNEDGKLIIEFSRLAKGSCARVKTSTFIPRELRDLKTGYVLVASPTVYPNQVVRAQIIADKDNNQAVRGRLFLSHYDEIDELKRKYAPYVALEPGAESELRWSIPECEGHPIAEIGIELTSGTRTDGKVFLNYLTWDGIPKTTFHPAAGTMWGRAWAKAIDRFEFVKDRSYEHLAHNRGTGLLIQGCREWEDYQVSATLIPQMARRCGIAVRVQGLKRYYAFVFCDDGIARIVRELDGTSVLAETPYTLTPFACYELRFEVSNNQLRGYIDGKIVLSAIDDVQALSGGALGILCDEGCFGVRDIAIAPLES